MTLPHESKEGSGDGESKEAGAAVEVNGAEDVKVEQASGGAVEADDKGHAAQPADEQAE